MFTIRDFLRSEVKPALGCTEPGAVALAVARAKEEIGGSDVRSIHVTVSDSIYKNGVAVGIPGTSGLKGNAIAAALGALAGVSSYGLEVLRDCTENDAIRAKKMAADGTVRVTALPDRHGVYVETDVTTENGTASCTIDGSHTSITKVTKNGVTTFETTSATDASKPKPPALSEQIAGMKYTALVRMVEDMNQEDVDYVMNGVDMNLAIAEYGFDDHHRSGLEIGKTIRNAGGLETGDLGIKIKAFSAAAADARMSGAPMPVMSSAGSGNHGVTAILPVAILGRENGKSREEIAKAVAFSHLSTSFIKSRTGRLSPICGCTVAAGAGAAAGMTWLLTGDVRRAVKAMSIVLANLVGMLCDGAKDTCALKVGTGAMEAYHATLLAMNDRDLDPQGVVDETIEATVQNVADISFKAMKDVDGTVIGMVSRRMEKAQ
jgi:L-cysteine desulfidase